MRCDSCVLLQINGLVCHETGCPDAWQTETRTCKWCGSTFTPDRRRQECCDESCNRALCGIPDDEAFNAQATGLKAGVTQKTAASSLRLSRKVKSFTSS